MPGRPDKGGHRPESHQITRGITPLALFGMLENNGVMSQRVEQFDTAIKIVTPENIEFRYRVAGPFRRLPAYFIDLAIRFFLAIATVLIALLVCGLLGIPAEIIELGALPAAVLWFLLAWFYGGIFEAFWNGQTPGKRMMQIRVLSVDGQPVGGMQAVLRNVLRVVDSQPPLLHFFGVYLLGLVTATLNDRFQRLGDLAAGTFVVVEEERWFLGVVRPNEPEVVALASQLPADFQPTRSLSRALAAYVQRRQTFHWPRRLAIARHLGEPLCERLALAPTTNHDLLLCALYYRTFITEGNDQSADEKSPFMETADPEVRRH